MAVTPHTAVTTAPSLARAAEGHDYITLLLARWALFRANFPDSWPERLPDSNLALFLIGMLGMRHGVIHDPRPHRRRILVWMSYGVFAWASWWLVLRHVSERATDPGTAQLATGLGLLQEMWICFTYAGAVLLLVAYRPWWNDPGGGFRTPAASSP